MALMPLRVVRQLPCLMYNSESNLASISSVGEPWDGLNNNSKLSLLFTWRSITCRIQSPVCPCNLIRKLCFSSPSDRSLIVDLPTFLFFFFSLWQSSGLSFSWIVRVWHKCQQVAEFPGISLLRSSRWLAHFFPLSEIGAYYSSDFIDVEISHRSGGGGVNNGSNSTVWVYSARSKVGHNNHI